MIWSSELEVMWEEQDVVVVYFKKKCRNLPRLISPPPPKKKEYRPGYLVVPIENRTARMKVKIFTARANELGRIS
jgi:hypothetical protein